MPKYSARDIEIVFAEYARTASIRLAAAAADMTQSWAYKLLREADLIRTHPPVFTARQAREAIALYRTGISCREVARTMAESHSPAPSQQWVFIRVQEAGILRSKSRTMQMRESRRHGKDFDRIRAIARVLAAEKLWSVRKIAEHLGVSKRTVHRALPASLRCNPSLATERRAWQAYLPDVERRRALRDEVIARRERGETYPQIRQGTGLSTSTISLYLHRAGLTKPIARRAE